MKKISRLLLVMIMIFSLSFNNISVVNAESNNSTTQLNFTPTQTISDSDKPILYFTDLAGKKVHSINYETGEQKSLSFTLAPERLTLSKGELFVTLLKSGHQEFGDSPEEASIAIIDASNLTLKEQFNVDIDPSDIVVDRQGYIYLFGGSHQWTYIKSYSRETKQVISSKSGICVGVIGQLHPTMNKVYFVDDKLIPKGMHTFATNNGSFTSNYYDWLYHYEYPSNGYFKISPDGKYIFNSAGTVFYATNDKSDDMTYITSIKGEFKDIAFDTTGNKFYTASSDNTINVYDYTDFRLLGKYNTSGSIQNILDGLHLDNPSDGIVPDNIISAVYDSNKNKVYAVDSAFKKLFIMDAATDTLEKTIDLQYKPSAITLSEDGTKLYIV